MPEKLRISIYVQPRASKTEIAGLHGGAIKVRLMAPPVDGAANSALIAFLADRLGISKSSIQIVAGEQSRTKIVEITTTNSEDVHRRLSVE